MPSLIELSLIGSFFVGAVVVMLVWRASDARPDCTIARVLYDVEHPEKRR